MAGVDQRTTGNLWLHPNYSKHFQSLVRTLDPLSIRLACYSAGLITETDKLVLSSVTNPLQHNDELLGILGRGDEQSFRVFCDILRDPDTIPEANSRAILADLGRITSAASLSPDDTSAAGEAQEAIHYVVHDLFVKIYLRSVYNVVPSWQGL